MRKGEGAEQKGLDKRSGTKQRNAIDLSSRSRREKEKKKQREGERAKKKHTQSRTHVETLLMNEKYILLRGQDKTED